MNEKLQGMQKEAIVAKFWCYHNIILEMLKRTTNNCDE
jgi:hypothetical protein